MTYDWLAALAFIASLVLMTMGLRWALWRVPCLLYTSDAADDN